jgi:predicted ATPase/DNA-binding CsgD family transcriptional regulator
MTIARSAASLALVEQRSRARLPRQLTSFIGRERELGDVAEALAEHRLVTICGPGGAGKTRLALAAAEQLLPAHPDGVALVELADRDDPDLVAGAVAAMLGVRERPEAGVLASLAESVGEAWMLVVLDNCEHVAEACAELVFGLLEACPEVRFLATSREPLGVPGELALRLPALPVPEAGATPGPQELLAYDSARLFVDRAHTFQPSFRLTADNAPAVATTCALTEGIPLAIELAAGRLTTLSAEQIADQLQEALQVLTSSSRLRPPRQRTLRATIDWSYHRLTPTEKLLLNRFSVFSGLADLEAVRAVCSDELLPAGDVLDHLARLIDKSLVQAEAAGQELRYRLLEVVRQYAGGRLAEAGEEEALRSRHATYFAELAEAYRQEQTWRRFPDWAQRLGAKRANFRAALAWSLQADPRTALRLATALAWFWAMLSTLTEGRRWLELALAAPLDDPELRGRALHGVGQIVYRQGDCPAAQTFLAEALAIERSLGKEQNEARVLRTLGLVLLSLQDFRRAEGCLIDALAIQRRLGERTDVARTLGSLALVANGRGRPDRARAHLEESIALARQSGDQWGLGTSIGVLGEMALDAGDLAEAGLQLVLSLRILGGLSEGSGVAYRLEGLARLAAARSEADRALTLAAAAAVLRTQIGVAAVPHWQRRLDDALSRSRRLLPAQAAAAAEGRGARMTTEQAIAYALEEQGRPRGSREQTAPGWASERSRSAGLSAREWDVLGLMMTGLSNRVIAGRLSISPNTVNKHVARVLDKLAARSRAQAIAIVLGLQHVD